MVPVGFHRDPSKHLQQSWGRSWLPASNTKITYCDLYCTHLSHTQLQTSVEPQRWLGFILGLILEERHEGTLRRYRHHPYLCPAHLHLGVWPPSLGGGFGVRDREARRVIRSAPHLGDSSGRRHDQDWRCSFPQLRSEYQHWESWPGR